MKYTDILFDLDGTVADSGDGIMNSTAKMLMRMNIPVPERSVLRKMVGPPPKEILPVFGVPLDKVDEAVKIYRSIYDNGGYLETALYSGVKELLQRLKNSGLRVHIATSKPEHIAVRVIEYLGITDSFDFIAAACYPENRITKAQVLTYLLDKVNPQAPLMVGDTDYDVIGANALNIPCIGVSWGFGNTESMKNKGAIAIAHTPDELFDLITKD